MRTPNQDGINEANDVPLFSIIIPTGGRPKTLAYSIRTVLAQQGSDFELIISDNDPSGNTRESLKFLCDSRVRYFRTATRLSMTDHWNFALSLAKGRYVMILGDDDGLVIDALERVRKALASHEAIDILYSAIANYQWPLSNSNGYFVTFPSPSGEGPVDLPNLLRRVLLMGGAGWDRLPSVYRAFVSIDLLHRIAKILDGKFTATIIPDVFLSIGIAALGDVKAYRLACPIAICGISYSMVQKKMPRLSAKNNEVMSPLLDQHMSEFGVSPLLVKLPEEFPRIFNSFAETMLFALEKFPFVVQGKAFNISAHYAWMASWSKAGNTIDFWLLRKRLNSYGFRFYLFFLWFIAFRTRHILSPLLARLMVVRRKVPRNVANVYEAALLLAKNC